MPTVAELSAKVSVDGMSTAIAELDRFDERLRSIGTESVDATVNADTTRALDNVHELQGELFDIGEMRPEVTPDVNTGQAEAEVETLRLALESLTNAVNSRVDLDTGEAQVRIEELRAQLLALMNAHASVDLDVAAALAHLVELEAALKAIPDEHVNVDVDSSGLDRLGSSATRASKGIRGLWAAVIVLAPALAAMSGVALAGLGAMSLGFVTAGLGAGLFAGVAVSNFNEIGSALKKIEAAQKQYNLAVTDKQRDTAMLQMKAAYDNLSPAQQKVVDGVRALGKAWGAFTVQFQPQMFSMAAGGLQFIASVIPTLTPLMNGMIVSAQTLGTRFKEAFNGPFWQTFMATASRIAGPIMTAMMTGFGNIIMGLAGMLQAFSPFAVGFAEGFQDMTAKFAQWGVQLGNSPGFHAFMAYVMSMMPGVLGLIGSLWNALIEVSKSLAEIGIVMVPVLTKFFDFITVLGQTNPDLLTLALILGIVGIGFLKIIGPISALVGVFGTISGWISTAATAMSGFMAANAALLGPITLAVAAVALLVAGAIYAYQHFTNFQGAVDSLGSKLSGIGAAIAGGFMAGWNAVSKFVSDMTSKVQKWATDNSALFQKAWSNVSAVISVALTAVVNVISTALDFIMMIWNAVWPGLSTVLGGVWTAIKGVVSGALDIILGVIKIFAGILAGDWGAVWDGLKQVVSGFKTAIVGVISGAWQAIMGTFQAFGGLLSAWWNMIWGGIVTVVSGVWGLITSAVSTGFNAVVGFFVSIGSSIASAWSTVWNGLVSFLAPIWASITSAVSTGFNAILAIFSVIGSVLLTIWNGIWLVLGPPVMAVVQILTAIVTGLWTILVTIFTGIWNGLVLIWNTLWTTITTTVSTAWALVAGIIQIGWAVISAIFGVIAGALMAVWNAIWSAIGPPVTTALSAVSNAVSTGMNAVTGFFSSAWNTITSAVSTAWNNITNWVSTGITNVQNAVTTGLNTISSTWNSVWNTVSSFLSGIWNTIRSTVSTAMSNVGSAVQTGINNALNWWKTGWSNFGNAISSAVSTIMGLINGLIKQMIDAVLGLGKRLYDAGASIMKSMADGIKSGIGAAVGAVKDGISAMTDLLPGSPAKVGPLSGQGYVLLRGQRFSADLAKGISLGQGGITNVTTQVSSVLAGVTPDRSFTGVPSQGGGGNTVQIAPGALVVNLGPGTDPSVAKAAFSDASGDLAEQILTAIKRR